jgi:hypothetical protein
VRILQFGVLGIALIGCASLLGIDGDYAVQLASDFDSAIPFDAARTLPDAPLTMSDGSASTTDGDATVNDANMSVMDTGVDTGAIVETGTPCLGHICNGVCLAGSDCLSCAGATTFCSFDRTCVSRCDRCSGASLDCTSCDGAVVIASTCEARNSAACVTNTNYNHCGCNTTPDCKSFSQVCVMGTCRTCGEPGTDGAVCKEAGNTCNIGDRKCS